MDADRISIAQTCVEAAHDASLSFPEIVGRLIAAGFESYTVDYRANTQTCYMPDSDHVTLAMPPSAGSIAPALDAQEVDRLVRWAQSNPADYTYAAFCAKAKAAGCAGYLVSFLGRRVVYFGRTAETHVEHFPD
ncbi:hypothetical protein SSBR45G_36630 [Bradyrhizobium sp. SSBR45G]|uniref:DUF1398 domain-containing protein n=1 Tax=unclassified Bradyrhizobium TaxID=2631580 RepID=UPI0023429328|nr:MULTISPECIES: DUF1398 domain-containing protein [unclassified Bradyrhizobium]GLH78754.1 hypothetical protein SSBR45G_36630 [Bradyrhizobium sp. SSBR45G]GLH86532.1 hypothetical protein SSBR45R_39920 [Bradyrhizobium sp. SSBR45R]